METTIHQKYLKVDSASSLWAISLFLVHVTRRLYECLFVNIFSSASMNMFHYSAGYLHYWGCITILFAYSPISSDDQGNLKLLRVYLQAVLKLIVFYHSDLIHFSQLFSLNQFHKSQVIGVLLFLYASYQQHSAHVTFANFRNSTNIFLNHKFPQ